MKLVDLRELRDELDEAAAERVANGRCGCGCGAPLERGANGRRKFVEGHRQRHYRNIVKQLAEAEGVPTRLSLRLVHSTGSTADRSGDAQKARRKRQSKPRAGLSVYFPTVRDVDLAAEWIDHLRRTDDAASTELDGVERALTGALARHARKAA